jgi:hypothetical protein
MDRYDEIVGMLDVFLDIDYTQVWPYIRASSELSLLSKPQ